MKSHLIRSALIYNMDAHRSNLPNLIAGAAGMFVNNTFFLTGLWAMLFAGKSQNDQLIPYFIALNVVVMTAWGGVNFFFGGLNRLGEYISEGTLEPMLATPRNPILLAAISRSSPVALGDFIMGLLGMIFIAWKLDPSLAFRTLIATGISSIGIVALFIFAGALSFFITRGGNVSQLVIELTLSLSVWPTGKIFSGAGRMALLLTPAAATAILPLDAVENAGIGTFSLSLIVALGFLAFAIFIFRLGLLRYKAVSLIGAQG